MGCNYIAHLDIINNYYYSLLCNDKIGVHLLDYHTNSCFLTELKYIYQILNVVSKDELTYIQFINFLKNSEGFYKLLNKFNLYIRFITYQLSILRNINLERLLMKA